MILVGLIAWSLCDRRGRVARVLLRPAVVIAGSTLAIIAIGVLALVVSGGDGRPVELAIFVWYFAIFSGPLTLILLLTFVGLRSAWRRIWKRPG